MSMRLFSLLPKKTQAFHFTQSEIVLREARGMKKTADIMQGFAERFEIAISQSRFNKSQCSNQTEALAKAIGVQGSVISDWRNANKLPSSKNIVRLALELDVTMDWLLTGRGHQRPGINLEDAELFRNLSLLSPEAKVHCASVIHALGDKIAQYEADTGT